MMSVIWTPGGTSRYAYLITQPFVMLRYFTTFFLPTDLSADSDWNRKIDFFSNGLCPLHGRAHRPFSPSSQKQPEVRHCSIGQRLRRLTPLQAAVQI
jgi:hypothetical protein